MFHDKKVQTVKVHTCLVFNNQKMHQPNLWSGLDPQNSMYTTTLVIVSDQNN